MPRITARRLLEDGCQDLQQLVDALISLSQHKACLLQKMDLSGAQEADYLMSGLRDRILRLQKAK